ncbi:hypothetical protein G6O67_005273 [Ophiocordyceps sinensis]|uniref:Flavin-containing monooxygenase n=1 Tax=Ophiocordyceps sinensis TaxID=72228 RepID=A0A8H4V613_9HYPO|nr:hypothetical protein G6O67_005273 [Ophiocordyceps sinensis]
MAAHGVKVQSPVADALPGSVNLPVAQFPAVSLPASVQPAREAAAVLEALNRGVLGADYRAVSACFAEGGFWRDHLALSWNFRTVQGQGDILRFLGDCARSKDGFRIKEFTLDLSSPWREPQVAAIDGDGKVEGVQAFFLFETVIGSGQGLMRLIHQHGKWAIFTIYTSLQALRGHEEHVFHRRPRGVAHDEKLAGMNWMEKRRVEAELEDDGDLAVLIIGSGQAGLTAAARLKTMGVNSLVIDQNYRVGDNWRKRYHQLVLHDPVWYDHMPYIAFPPQWPIFTPKDKLAQFFEAYVHLLELNVWSKSTVTSSKRDEAKGMWTVTVQRHMDDGSTQTRTLHPRHIIQATGLSGQKHQPQIKGAETFKGDRICHSSEFPGAQQSNRGGKKAVIIGSCNSGHDIAQDFFDKGYDVTMVQRSSTCVVSIRGITDTTLKGVYAEDGPPVDDADMLTQSLPSTVLKAMHAQVVQHQKALDKETIDGLERAGFKVNHGSDDMGLIFKYLQRGGGYYIDVGTSRLLANGSIKVRQGQEVAEILPRGVRLADGSELEADQVVLATGYDSMKSQTRVIFGDEVADRVGDVWGFNDEGEMRTIWQPSGHPGLWLHGGNLALCRYYSKLLALQIKGLEAGLYRPGEI